MGLLNARSAKQQDAKIDKPAEIHNLIVDKKLHALVITETWLRPGNLDCVALGEMTPAGYEVQHIPRPNRRGPAQLQILKTFHVLLMKGS